MGIQDLRHGHSLPKPFCSPCALPGVVHAHVTFGHRTSGLCASILLRGRFVFCPLNLGANALSVGRDCMAAPPWTPGAQIPVLSSHVKVVVFVLFHCSSFFPL